MRLMKLTMMMKSGSIITCICRLKITVQLLRPIGMGKDKKLNVSFAEEDMMLGTIFAR